MRVLLVDDNARRATMLAAALGQQGYSVDVANSLAEGDELASVDHHDLIILEVMGPDGGGVRLCRSLRRRRIAAPILMLSTLTATEDVVAGLDAGADDYVTRPYRTEELLARVRSLLRRSSAAESSVLRSGDLEMDLHQHRVRMNGTPLKLSAKEFALLEFMMRRAGQLLTRAMIGESVWDMNHESNSNVIDVYVSSLRRKIDRTPGKPRIETVIGSGYRFVDVGQSSGEAAPRLPAS